MKEVVAAILLFFAFVVGWFARSVLINQNQKQSVDVRSVVQTKPLEKYSIENIARTNIEPGKINIKRVISDEDQYTSYLFEFKFSPTMDGKSFKKTTGQINIPKTSGPYPAILMLRGYIDQKTYRTGDGTRNSSIYFAKNGFLTVAPDFLGYGESDEEAGNIFEARFQTYVTAISLLRTIEQLSSHPALITSGMDISPFDISSIYIWGHSNGGQIALTLLEESGVTYPTVLWAPVSKPFPYSVLFYTDVSEDHGKLIRKELSKFEEDYDVEKYSLTNYLNKIQAPIQLNQGTSDDAVPVSWSDNLSQNLKVLNKDIIYYTYPGTNHNMTPSWNDIISKGLSFFNSYLNP